MIFKPPIEDVITCMALLHSCFISIRLIMLLKIFLEVFRCSFCSLTKRTSSGFFENKSFNFRESQKDIAGISWLSSEMEEAVF